MNEGFTVFTERKIAGRMAGGEPARSFSALGGWKALKYNVRFMYFDIHFWKCYSRLLTLFLFPTQIDIMGATNPLTNLVVDLNGVDPDDAFSTVPYEKGSTFLWYLEDVVGGPGSNNILLLCFTQFGEKFLLSTFFSAVFEPFLRAYYDTFKYQSIDSYEFKNFFLKYFKDKDTSSVDWDTWFFKPGMPIYKPNFDESMAKVCQDLRTKWVRWQETEACPMKSTDLDHFTSGQKIEFLALMLEEAPLSIAKLEKMQALYNMDSVTNSEIKFRWIRLGLRGKWNAAVPKAVQMVTEQGRMKFLRPIYRDLYEWEETRETATQTFLKNKDSMMHVAVQGLEIDLKLKE